VRPPVFWAHPVDVHDARLLAHPGSMPRRPAAGITTPRRRSGQNRPVTERNVLGGDLAECGTDPMTGFYRTGTCTSGEEDLGSHTVCAVMTADFLAHQQEVGNDLVTPRPEWGFPGLRPGDRWCVVAARWLQAHLAGRAAPVVLAASSVRALEVVPLALLRQYAVDVPDDPGGLS